MTKLVHDFSLFNAKKTNINTLVDNYKIILDALAKIENDVTQNWDSGSAKEYYIKVMERKKELDELYKHYQDLVAFLNAVTTKYQQIESNYL